MSQAFSLQYDADLDKVLVAGELSFACAAAVVEQAKRIFADLTELDIDLAEVTRSDSAGVAVLIDWMRYAKQNNKPVVFHNVPAQLIAIASASGLDEELPVA